VAVVFVNFLIFSNKRMTLYINYDPIITKKASGLIVFLGEGSRYGAA
jgi:hypothetical protein